MSNTRVLYLLCYQLVGELGIPAFPRLEQIGDDRIHLMLYLLARLEASSVEHLRQYVNVSAIKDVQR